MDSVQRREEIIKVLSESSGAVNASSLAERFGVTRQIIVSDIALLRANGNDIIATNRGYTLQSGAVDGNYITVVVKHTHEQTLDEFYAVVDNGGTVVNVIVDHPLYGQISADLNIASRYDAQEFVERAKSVGASQLCELTDGVHVHTIKIPDSRAGERIVAALRAQNILIEQ